MPDPVIPVHNGGYVRLRGQMTYFECEDHEVQIVNAARASYEKEVTELDRPDIGLLNFLIRRNEDSPFRHSYLGFGVRAPLMVARQWFKYQVGSSHLIEGDATNWNETSRRYVSSEPEFYTPEQWLSAPEHTKQGSGKPLGRQAQGTLAMMLRYCVEDGVDYYQRALQMGVAPEQARLFLPAYGLYVTWVWTASILSVLHFLDQRLVEKAQSEIRPYARGVRELVRPYFPHSLSMLGPLADGD